MKVFIKVILVVVVLAWSVQLYADNPALAELEDRIYSEMEAVIDETGEIPEEDLTEFVKLMKQGIEKHDEGELEKAIELYEKALKKNPISGEAYYEIAYSYHSMGKLQKSLEALIRAIALDPKAEIAYVMKAGVLDDMGLPEEAIEAYHKIIEIKPDSFMAILNLGITLFRENDYDQAVLEFERAHEIVPEHPSPFYYLANIANYRGETYEEERYLKEFIRVGEGDGRLPMVEQRLKELTTTSVSLNIFNIDDPNKNIVVELMEQGSRALWRTETHRETFPDAKGYYPSFEEELDIIQKVIGVWKEQKEKDSSLSHPAYDFAETASEAGYLEEYVWFVNQRKLGQSAEDWLADNEPRVSKFVAWAENAGFSDLISEALPSEPAESIGPRDLPGIVMKAADESDYMYEIGIELEHESGDAEEKFRKQESKRFKDLFGKDGNTCVGKKDARNALEDAPNEIVPIAYRKVVRVFYPGDEEWETAIQLSSRLGRRYRDLAPSPSAYGVLEKKGDRILVKPVDPDWVLYYLAKAVWRYEPGFRQQFGGMDDDSASVSEEEFAWATMVGGYLNSLEAEEDPAQPDPYLDSVAAAFQSGGVTGFVLMEVLHKTYGVSLECLPEEYTKELEYYFLNFALERMKAEDLN